MTPLLIKNYLVAAATEKYRIVCMSDADYKVAKATGGASPIVGVVENPGITADDITAGRNKLDVIRLGLGLVEAGGVISRGAYVTADANGRAVAATLVAGANLHVLGRAEVAAVSGDVIPVLIDPTVIGTDVGSVIQTTDITVSAAEMLALFATPKQLVAAPGAGKALLLESAQFFLDYGTAAYAGIAAGEDLSIKYTNAAGAEVAQIETTGFLDATADAYRHVYPKTTAAIVPVENAALVLHLLTAEIITGDSPLKVRVRTRTVDLAF